MQTNAIKLLLAAIIASIVIVTWYRVADNAEIAPTPVVAASSPSENPDRPMAARSWVPGAVETGSPPTHPRPAQDEPSPKQHVWEREAQIAMLDERLRAEPVDHHWAMAQQKVIRDAIKSTPNGDFDALPPSSFQEQCHSSLCRISMTFSDEEDALQMMTKLALGLRGPIATTRTFYSPMADGGMEVVVYAGELGRIF